MRIIDLLSDCLTTIIILGLVCIALLQEKPERLAGELLDREDLEARLMENPRIDFQADVETGPGEQATTDVQDDTSGPHP